MVLMLRPIQLKLKNYHRYHWAYLDLVFPKYYSGHFYKLTRSTTVSVCDVDKTFYLKGLLLTTPVSFFFAGKINISLSFIVKLPKFKLSYNFHYQTDFAYYLYLSGIIQYLLNHYILYLFVTCIKLGSALVNYNISPLNLNFMCMSVIWKIYAANKWSHER